MSKEEKDIKVNVQFNIEAVESAMTNADRPHEATLVVNSINPQDLRLGDEVFNVILKPITFKPGTKSPKKPKLAVHAAIIGTKVKALALSAVDAPDDTITVNGTIDIPLKTGMNATMENLYFPNEETARAIARIYTRVQLNKLAEIEDRLEQEKNFLLEQQEEDRY